MSQLKVLNIDTLSKQERVIVLGGVEHKVHEMSVENFLETTAALNEIEASGFSLDKQVLGTVDMIMRSVPTAPRELLVKVPMSQLQTIVAYVRGDEIVQEQQVEGDQQAPAGEKPAKKRARK